LATLLCHSEDIIDPGCKGFQIKSGEQITDIFVVRKGGQFYGYINSCPHTGVNLDWQAHQFLDMDRSFIQCSTHGALFEITTGQCIAGPCAGDHLTAINLSIDSSDNKAAILAEL
jgi:nitrite reductase/ring-hydroxylating ferredoxin subunit